MDGILASPDHQHSWSGRQVLVFMRVDFNYLYWIQCWGITLNEKKIFFFLNNWARKGLTCKCQNYQIMLALTRPVKTWNHKPGILFYDETRQLWREVPVLQLSLLQPYWLPFTPWHKCRWFSKNRGKFYAEQSKHRTSIFRVDPEGFPQPK